MNEYFINLTKLDLKNFKGWGIVKNYQSNTIIFYIYNSNYLDPYLIEFTDYQFNIVSVDGDIKKLFCTFTFLSAAIEFIIDNNH